MRSKQECSLCGNVLEKKYLPMAEWQIKGILCGNCYSEKLAKFYPGEHVRVNKTDSD